MTNITNTFKQALNQGKVKYGCWLTLADAYAAEVAATANFDWLLIDAEHAPNDLRSILAQLQAIAPYPSQPVIRPANGDPVLIKQLLDIGAQSLLIPMIETAEQARLMVKSVTYPPTGIRGVGAAIARASRWNQISDYHEQIENQICLILQLESKTGLENLDAILEVDGVDGIFIGPADLAASLGHLGESGHPEVQAEIAKAIEKITAAGKAAGILTTEPALATAYAQQGATFIAVGVDVLVYSGAMNELANQYKG